jgi:hypothetical protein
MSTERGSGGKNSNCGWSNLPEPPADPVVDAWVAALWSKPFTWEEYEEQRRIAAERTAAQRPKKALELR